MSEETTNTQTVANPEGSPATPNQTPVSAPAQTQTTQEELDALNREIAEANKSIISDDTASKIAIAKEEARKEAEKEFATNAKIKEMQELLEKQKKEKEEFERKAADQLEGLKSKLDSAISSQAISTSQNPFNQPEAKPHIPTSFDEKIDAMSEDEFRTLERRSMEELLGRTISKQ